MVVAANHPRYLGVKFQPDAGVQLRLQSFQGIAPSAVALDLYLDAIGATRHRDFAQSDEWLRAWRESGEARSGQGLVDLTSYYRIELPRLGLVAEACDALSQFEGVELARPLPSVDDPVAAPLRIVRGSTPDFVGQQAYRGPAPVGIDADYGNTFSGGAGIGITIADIETGWTDDHEDLAHKGAGNCVGLAPTIYPWDHGTAVLGELIGEDNGQGVRGLCNQADFDSRPTMAPPPTSPPP